MAETKRKSRRRKNIGFIGEAILVSGGLLVSLLAKNAVAKLEPVTEQSFYPYAVELGSGIGLAIIAKAVDKKSSLAEPILIGSLAAIALTGVSALTANTNENMLFQPAPKFLAY